MKMFHAFGLFCDHKIHISGDHCLSLWADRSCALWILHQNPQKIGGAMIVQ